MKTGMNVKTIILWVPQYMDTIESEWFFWPALEALACMLLDDMIESLRLFLAEICGNQSEEVFVKTTLEPITLPEDEVLEDIYAVEQVLYSEMRTSDLNEGYEYAREDLGLDEVKQVIQFQRSLREKRRRPFKVERENGVKGIEETVIVFKKKS